MLVKKEKITDTMYEKANLLAFYDEDFREDYPYQLVTIIKNRYTGITGTLPLKDYTELKEKYEPEDNSEEDFNNLNEFFTSMSEVFKKTFDDIKETIEPEINAFKDDMINGLSDLENSIKLEKLKSIRKMVIDEGLETKGFIKKIDKRIFILDASSK